MKKILSYLIVPYYRLLRRDIRKYDYVLDVGCGRDSCLRHIPFKDFMADGIEIDLRTYNDALHSKFYQKVYLCDALQGMRKLHKRYDVVLLSDFIEHLEKPIALKVIHEAERLGRKVIIYTPLGFLEQGAYDGNLYQRHRSGWALEELVALGYESKVIKNFNIQSIYAVKKTK